MPGSTCLQVFNIINGIKRQYLDLKYHSHSNYMDQKQIQIWESVKIWWWKCEDIGTSTNCAWERDQPIAALVNVGSAESSGSNKGSARSGGTHLGFGQVGVGSRWVRLVGI